jgi:hypothetical protein
MARAARSTAEQPETSNAPPDATEPPLSLAMPGGRATRCPVCFGERAGATGRCMTQPDAHTPEE